MIKLLVVISIAIGYTAAVHAADSRTISFYAVQYVHQEPVIDGNISDIAWQEADESTTYFEYWKPDPGVGELATSLRMVYSDRGIYLAVVNYDEHVDLIRAEITTRDDPVLWKDDCNEIYFDPAAMGVGFTRFVVNSLGTQQDDRRIDAAVSLKDWSGTDWQVATQVNGDSWNIEAFFPWDDLGQVAGDGDLWKFNHVRYGYSSGGFKGVTWSPGGNYSATENFGYLYFTQTESMSVDRIASLLTSFATPPWQLWLNDAVLVCDVEGNAKHIPVSTYVESSRRRVEEIIVKIESQLDKTVGKFREELGVLQKRLAEVPAEARHSAEAIGIVRTLSEIRQEADELYWQIRLNQLLVDI